MHKAQIRPIFARHETFQPRFGWLQKAYLAGEDRNGADFAADDATVRLGVGKNMVRAIRFWGEAAKVLEVVNSGNRRVPSGVKPSEFGRALLGHDGWDPYLESPGALWLLHWAMLRPVCDLPVWWVAFNEFNAIEFQSVDILERASRECQAAGFDTSDSSLKKDVECCLRMYAGSGGSSTPAAAVESPFVALGLVTRGGAGSYRFMLGPKGTLASEIVVFAALDYMLQNGGMATATLTALANDPGSPGRVFKLTDDDISDAIELTSKRFSAIELHHPAGARQLTAKGDLGDLAARVLDSYFARTFGLARLKTRTSRLFAAADLLAAGAVI